jgi:hypothetical protein
MTDQSQCPFADSWKAAAEASELEDDHQLVEPGRVFAALPWLGLQYEYKLP